MKYCFMRFPEGRFKAVTFSYDDGVKADLKLAEIIDKYGIKATFNLCDSGLRETSDDRLTVSEALDLIARGHEVANHGYNHVALGISRHFDGIKDVLDCRLGLEKKLGRLVRGFAYPDTMRNISGDTYLQIKGFLEGLGITYARLCGKDNDSFDLPTDFYAWYPNAHHDNPEIMNYLDKFLGIEEKKLYSAARHPRLFYMWGHSAEFSEKGNWDHLEEIAEKLSTGEDIWFATNTEIYEYVKAYESLVFSADGGTVYNPTLKKVWFVADGVPHEVASGETIKL